MNTWRFKAAAGALLVCIVMIEGGCWGRKFFRMPSETLATSSKVDTLLMENAALKERIARIEGALREDQEFTRGTNAQLKMDLEELKDQLNALQEMLRDEEERSSYKPAERRRVARPDTVGLTRPARSGSTGGTGALSPSAESRGDTTRSQARRVPGDTLSGAGGKADTAGALAAPAPPPEELYRQIYLDYSRREYQIALEESENFMSEYPDDPLGEEVLFIRGECLMELTNNLDALKEFSTLIQQYPRGKRAPGSLFRMAVLYGALGQKEVEAGVVRRLIKEYPHSEEAKNAEERFGALLKQ